MKEPQHLRLRGNVEPRDDLVGEHEIGPQHHGAGDADALPLAAGELVGVAVDRAASEADAIEHAVHQRERRRSVVCQAMEQNRLDQDASDRMPRIERGHRVLEDHLHAPAQRPPRALVERADVDAVEQDRAGRRHDETEQRPAERGLAGAGLADNADGLALADRDVDAVEHRRRGGPRPSRPEGRP